MEIQWVGSPNFNSGRNGYHPIAIFFHIEDGTETGTMSWFQNSIAQVSAHYSISRTGAIYQYVKEEDEAWAVGLVNAPTWKYYNQHVNPNYTTISIENEGRPEDGFTEAQIQANILLAAQIAKRWSIPVDEDSVENHNRLCGHYQLDSINRKQCPSDNFPWERVIKGVQQLLYGNQEDEEDMALREEFESYKAEVESRFAKMEQERADQTVSPWAKASMDKAVKFGVIVGDEHGNLNPNSFLTREQFAVVNDREGILNFKDQTVADYAKVAFDKAVECGLVHGDGQGNLNPNAPLTRQDFFVFLNRMGALDFYIQQMKGMKK